MSDRVTNPTFSSNDYSSFYKGLGANGGKLAQKLGYTDFESMKNQVLESKENAIKFLEKTANITASDTILNPNEIINMPNLMIDTLVWQGLKFRNPYAKMFFREKKTPFGDTVTIAANGYLEPTDWDADKFVPTSKSIPEQFKVYIRSTIRKKFVTTIYRDVIRAAFSNYYALDDFIADYLGSIERSFQIWYFNLIGDDIKNSIKNSITSTATDWAGITSEFATILESLKLPTSKYNAGFGDDGKTLSTKVNNINSYNDLMLIMNAKTYAVPSNTYLPYLMQQLGINPFKLNITIDNRWADGNIAVLTRETYYATARIDIAESQYFAENMAYNTYHNFWPVQGLVPFNIGFIYIFTLPKSTANLNIHVESSETDPVFTKVVTV